MNGNHTVSPFELELIFLIVSDGVEVQSLLTGYDLSEAQIIMDIGLEGLVDFLERLEPFVISVEFG